MSYTYWLPNPEGRKVEYTTTSNAVFIIGSNGSGKSKLGAWIEQQNFSMVHRIGAQRNLNFNENIALKSYSQAENFVFYGEDTPNNVRQKNARWNWGKSYTTKLMDDFENVLAAIIALKNNDLEIFLDQCRQAESENKTAPHTPCTAIDKLTAIWDDVFPQRELRVIDSKFTAAFQRDGSEIEYSANQMSDGERSVLYLAAQVLCVPQNKIMIIDEPEIHLHRSIMNRLWKSLEHSRPDCLFIYITHDTEFASLHNQAEKIWIKNYDGKNWQLEKLEDSNLPEDLLLSILGNRKNVIFIEGEKSSIDIQLYTALFPQYYVIPCGSCTQVILRTKAFMSSPLLHHYAVYGIIDRDFRSEDEIVALKDHRIFTLPVAEIENMLIVEPLVRLMAAHMGQNADEVFERIKDYVVIQRFSKQINSQICHGMVAQIKYKLSCAKLSGKSESDVMNGLTAILDNIDYSAIKNEQEIKFKTALSNAEYDGVLKVFNEKSMASSVGHFMGIENKAYCSTIIGLLSGDKHDDIIAALQPYLPSKVM